MAVWASDSLRARGSRGSKKQAQQAGARRRPRGLTIEPLEQRVLFAISPTLVSIIPNEGAILVDGSTRNVAPRELTFRFDEGQIIDANTLSGIQVTRSGSDRTFGTADDQTVALGYIGIGNSTNEVIARFADTLPDDNYRITIVGAGAGALRNTEGDAFNNGVNKTLNVRLDLGAQVVAVVPQPITRDASGNLVQARNQIAVYFNDDVLDVASAQNTAFYQLIFTGGTADNHDDAKTNPTSVTYNPTTKVALLVFAGDLANLGTGTFRLRIGDNSLQATNPQPPVTVDVSPSMVGDQDTNDPGSSLTTARNVGALGANGLVIGGGAIDSTPSATNVPYTLNLPGGNGDPGHRENPVDTHVTTADNTPGITTLSYNFKTNYGEDPDGNPLFNVITETQKQRFRQVFELYSHYLGVQFVETADEGFTIAVGDIRAVDPTAPTDRGGLQALSDPVAQLTVIDNSENWGDSAFGSPFFHTAMHEVGHLLGIDNDYELGGGTIMADGGERAPNSAEGVFPTANDIIHGQHLFRPESKDIDYFRFSLASNGRLTAETIAERLTEASSLDTVISLFDSTGKLIARNDNYFSEDSFVDLDLAAGTYYIAVSSTGNTSFDPAIVDSGFGGTTEGKYSLRLNFTPAPTGSFLKDATGTQLDGDLDGVAGGAFNFWFDVRAVQDNIYVDKMAPSAGANGTLAHPYNNLQTALGAAQPNQIVRIVGNGGADGNVATLGDNRAYEIGFDNTIAPSQPLADGINFDIPQGVTVMIDAGAIFKLSKANVNAGSFAQGVDLSEGALQVLGTPTSQVIFTSYHAQTVGVDTNPRQTTPGPGDWGGLVFRDDSDRESQGIFLNYVANAVVSFGGGSVLVDSEESVYSSIHLEKARPKLAFNVIAFGADAAISADPDSFEESLFHDDSSSLAPTALFDLGYRRVGPDIHGNRLSSNSTNALFVRIRTEAGTPLDVLNVAGRFDDKDIVHVVSENLYVRGTPGGQIDDGNGPQARLDARLSIDPGIIVKLLGSRIEVEMGAQLIAEGKGLTQVVFTSLADDRYGAGGVFNTAGLPSTGTEGDWGGLYFHPASEGSLDHVLITFAGGNAPIEGTFADFSAIEIRQADVRIANSVLENNADGFARTTDRAGRGWNVPSTIFVRGAQPILINNILRNNRGDAISIDANSLTSELIGDSGRTTGPIERYTTFDDNHGPLVQENRLVENDVNGMAVRGAENKSNIEFRIGPGLAGNEAAIQAFELAAAAWEAIFKDPINIMIDIDLRSLASDSILGQALSVFQPVDYDLIRQLMIDDAQPSEEILFDLPTMAQLISAEAFYLANPPGNFPIYPSGYPLGALQSTMRVNRATALALGMSPSELLYQASEYDPSVPIDAKIEFNSKFAFDYDPSDGIGPGLSNFVEVAMHEIGHALGFTSYVDTIDAALPAVIPIFMSPLDMFRLPPGYGFEDFKFAPRIFNPAFPSQVFYDGGVFDRVDVTGTQPEGNLPQLTVGDIPLSRGQRFGDGNQASHWRNLAEDEADFQTAPIGIMDPTGGSPISSADIRALELIGYDTVARSATINTQTIWDDTDIVHVVRDEIHIPDVHTIGGLRLQSSASESLVIKLDGEKAGFTAGGQKLDVVDRIGGTFQVIGRPGHPVVLTSLKDPTVGAGTDLTANPQKETVEPVPPELIPTTSMNIEFRAGPGLTNNPAALAAFQAAAALWESYLKDPITIVLDIDLTPLPPGLLGGALSTQQLVSYDTVRQLMIADGKANEAILNQLPTFAELTATLPNGATLTNQMQVNRANLKAIGFPADQLIFQASAYDPTTAIDGSIRFNSTELFDFDPTNGIDPGSISFVEVAAHEIGHALGFVSFVDDIDAGATSVTINPLDLFRLAPGAGQADFRNSPRLLDPEVPEHMFYDGGIFNRPDVTISPRTVGDIPLSRGQSGDGNQASHWADDAVLGVMTQIGLLDPIAGTTNPITSADVRAFDLIGYDAIDPDVLARLPMPGDWRSIKLGEFTNDRNVEIVNEAEPTYTGTNDINLAPNAAQFLGTLAANEQNGDENRRLGFEVHGFISLDRSGDRDVYSFNGTAGTEVWLDIDRTSVSLDTVVELLDANGNVLARSNNSAAETIDPTLLVDPTISGGNRARILQRGSLSGPDLYSSNPKDAGMRIVLPGTAGSTNTYYVRVRSNSTNLNSLTGGLSRGEYQLQIRLRETDEVAGSTVRYADIRYATSGIEVLGLPAHSPLVGEIGRADSNNFNPLVAQDLGNILAMDRGTISLSARQEDVFDVQWYKFTVDYTQVESVAGYTDGPKTVPLVFDLDYADGIARPDLTVSIFESVEPDPRIIGLKLLGYAEKSNIADDQPPPIGSGANDLSRGSFGQNDPFLGSLSFAEGTIKTYYVAITTSIVSPLVFAQYELSENTPTITVNKLFRLEPVNSVQRVVEDHIGEVGYQTGDPAADPPIMVLPESGPVLPITTFGLSQVVEPWTLANMPLYVGTGSTLRVFNALTADPLLTVGNYGNFMGDIAIRSDGYMFGARSLPGDTSNGGRLVNINPNNATTTDIGEDGIADPGDPTMPEPEELQATGIDAMAYQWFEINDPAAVLDGNTEHYLLYYSVHGPQTSHLFVINATDGTGADDNLFWGPVSGDSLTSTIVTPQSGYTTGMAFVGGTLYGVSDKGEFYSINTGSGVITMINPQVQVGGQNAVFAGLTAGPQNLQEGEFANTVFAVTAGGQVVALDIATGNLLTVFEDDTGLPLDFLDLGVGGATGIAFGAIDANPWHVTTDRGGPLDPGHGVNPTSDNSRPGAGGGNSFYFGIDLPGNDPTGDAGEQWGFTPEQQIDLTAYLTGDQVRPDWLDDDLFAELMIGKNYNVPGGANGNLITRPFSLENSEKPFLYFNYYRLTSAGDAPSLSISVDGGLTWEPVDVQLFNTNLGDVPDPFDDRFWRQARVDLADFAGEEEVQIRFEFTASISANLGEGMYIDDLIVGDVGRGELATGPVTPARDALGILVDPFGNTLVPDYDQSEAFLQTGNIPGPGEPQKVFTGSFQLEIRRSTEFARLIDPTLGTSEIYDQFRWDDRLNNALTLVSPAATSLVTHSVLSLQVPSGATLVDGETFTLTDDARVGQSLTFEFDSDGTVGAGNIAVPFTTTDTPVMVARAVVAAINLETDITFRIEAQVNTITTDRVELDGATDIVLGAGATTTRHEIQVGDSFELDDGVNPPETFVFDTVLTPGVNVILFKPGDGVREIATAIDAAINLRDNPPPPIPPAPAPGPFDVSASHSKAGDAIYLAGATAINILSGNALTLVETILDGEFFTVSDGVNSRTFEFDRNDSVTAGRIAIPITFEGPEATARKIRNAINAQNGATFVASAGNRTNFDRVDLNRVAFVNTSGTPLMGVIQFGETSIYTGAAADIEDGETFTLFDGLGTRVFEFDLDGALVDPNSGNIAIPIAGNESAIDMAKIVADAVNSQTNPADFAIFAQPPTSNRVDLVFVVSATEDVDDLAFKAISYSGMGDRNQDSRDQGVVLIQGNRISLAQDYGIMVDAGFRDDDSSRPGATRNLRELNNGRLVPGPVIVNNIIDQAGLAGILFSGDPSGGDPNDDNLSLAPIPFGRILNNTIYGHDGGGIGIDVKNNASPTLLNNIVANLNTGIQVSGNSASTVVGETLYQNNTTNTKGTGLGAFALVLGANEPLFVNAAAGNFNLAPFSRAIDSAINSLVDRPAMTTVLGAVGIGPSPILAPLTDQTGKLRIDEPSVPSLGGLGQNVFKDRGALDRTDFVGPTASLQNPLDNDGANVDQDPTLNDVLYTGAPLTNFQLRLTDGTGIGIDDTTVAGGKFVLRRNGVVLVEGVDYTFTYDDANDIARFTPVVGIWVSDSVYSITVDNTAATGIKDLSGNRLLPNSGVDQTVFNITLKSLDFGDAQDPLYPTLLINEGARHVIVPGFFLGAGVTADADGQPSSQANGDVDDGVVFNNTLLPGQTANITVTASSAGLLDAWIDFNDDGDWSDPGEQIFASRALVGGPNPLSFVVPGSTATQTTARFRFSSAGGLSPTGLADDGEVEDYRVDIPVIVSYTVGLYNPTTGKELLKDAAGRYVVIAGTTVQARVFVDDLRAEGAAGGVRAAFADLAYDNDMLDFVGGSLVVGPDYATGTSGTINEAGQLVDEAGGTAGASPLGSDPKRLLFSVNATLKSNVAPGSTFSLGLGSADVSPSHDTFVYGFAGAVPSSYQTITVIVPTVPWQNPSNGLDVNADGFVVSLDALLIINRLNTIGPGKVPDPVPAGSVPPYYDVNGDGFVTALDALLVINFLNAQAAASAAASSGGGAALRAAPVAAGAGDATTPSQDIAAAALLAAAGAAELAMAGGDGGTADYGVPKSLSETSESSNPNAVLPTVQQLIDAAREARKELLQSPNIVPYGASSTPQGAMAMTASPSTNAAVLASLLGGGQGSAAPVDLALGEILDEGANVRSALAVEELFRGRRGRRRIG